MSDIATPSEFFGAFMPNGGQNSGITLKTATVISISNGQAVIQFDEDETPSQKIYKAVESYTPAAGQRVMLINNIIIGGWTT